MNATTDLLPVLDLGVDERATDELRDDPRIWRPLNIPWKPKPLHSAVSGVEVLPDGRMHCWIEHEVLRGVAPRMLAWWFANLEGPMVYAGRRLPRYSVWHPLDHVQVRYARRRRDGTVGVVAVIHLTEMLGGRPDRLVDVHTTIVRLDAGGFAHRPRWFGLQAAAMDYTFEAVAGGTRYRNSLTVGFAGRWARPLNTLIRRFVFDIARGHAWVRHNVEEVGQFEAFLPALFAAETAQGGAADGPGAGR
ncbi:MAG: hypothetical protein KF683_16950 [Rubrivivax sp.]|nr:hypothetical protein [Rubrivivax sp.]